MLNLFILYPYSSKSIKNRYINTDLYISIINLNKIKQQLYTYTVSGFPEKQYCCFLGNFIKLEGVNSKRQKLGEVLLFLAVIIF